jgi:hypothetical protein
VLLLNKHKHSKQQALSGKHNFNRGDRAIGINTHVYSYWGVRTEWNEEFWEKYNEIEEAAISKYGYNNIPADCNVEVLSDGMSCEYMIFGVQLYDSGDARWGEMVNSNEVEIDDDILNRMRDEYMTQFKRLYPDQYEWLAAKPWRLVNLVHYS